MRFIYSFHSANASSKQQQPKPPKNSQPLVGGKAYVLTCSYTIQFDGSNRSFFFTGTTSSTPTRKRACIQRWSCYGFSDIFVWAKKNRHKLAHGTSIIAGNRVVQDPSTTCKNLTIPTPTSPMIESVVAAKNSGHTHPQKTQKQVPTPPKSEL